MWSAIDHLVVLFFKNSTVCYFFCVRFKTAYNDLIAYQFQLTNGLLRAECAVFAHIPRVS